jgi:hypothetical protein
MTIGVRALSALPNSAHPAAKKVLVEIWNAEDRDHAHRAFTATDASFHFPLTFRRHLTPGAASAALVGIDTP